MTNQQIHSSFPKITLLIPARNEAKNILNLLHSIEELAFPKNEMEVLIGDDNSTDKTAELVAKFIENKPYFKLISIEESTTQYKGKTNALIQLINHATGDYYFFTDADIQLPSTWINAMLNGFTENVGVVVGTTTTMPITLFARMQGIEWLMVLKFIETMSKFGVKSTGLGNNMVVTKKAYWAVGGYENMPFSIVEDFALYEAIIEKGIGFKHLYSSSVLAFTKPPESYFSQRKRWVSGGIKSNSPFIIIALLQALLLPFMLFLLISIRFEEAILCFLIVAGISIFSGVIALQKARLQSWLIYLPIYTVYFSVMPFLVFMHYLFPRKITWKGRDY